MGWYSFGNLVFCTAKAINTGGTAICGFQFNSFNAFNIIGLIWLSFILILTAYILISKKIKQSCIN
jgi:hypothetical protein